MKNKLFRSSFTLIIIFSIAFFCTVNAQNGFERNDSSVVFSLQEGSLNIQVCSEQIIRITHSPAASIIKPVVSLSVNAKWDKVPFDIHRRADGIIIETKKLVINVNNATGSISISDKAGNLLFKENPVQPVSFTKAVVLGEKTHHAQLNFQLSSDEGVFGLGQYQSGVMNYRGHVVTLIQENTQIAVPFLMSTKKYGLMFDNYSKIIFDDRNGGSHFWFEVADYIDYYFIAGSDMDEIIKGYRLATGKAPMFPKWAYGYFQSKERYKTQEELLSIAKEFRDRRIPVDCIVQDWQYWGDDNAFWNAMRFDSARYPNPRLMINDLHKKYNMRLMVSIWPVPGQKTDLYRELDSKGLLYPTYHWTDGRTYDAYSPEARRLYWDGLNRGLFSLGVDAFWMDATEPEIFLAPTERSTKAPVHNALGTMARYFNPYSLLTTESVYKGQRSVTSNKRVFILTRSAFLGQQRNAAAAWSGDIVADWNVFRNQIPAGLNFCMSGLPYWTNDIGGFHLKRYGGFPEGSDDPGYRELYVRWFQFGAFNPIFRSHGTDVSREPWRFGEPGSWAYDAILRFNRLRYRLIPYIYSLAWQVTNKGYTIMRGLPMDFPADPAAYNTGGQFMFGPALLVNPVTRHMYYGESYINELIPKNRLRTPGGQTGGFRAEYFNGITFDTLKVDSIQTDMLFDMYLGKDLPPVVDWEYNSIRWSGSFRSQGAGSYELWLNSDDAVRFFIDRKIVVDGWNNLGKDTTYRVNIPLQAEHWYSFRIEYSRQANATKLRLGWRTPEMVTEKMNPAEKSGTWTVYLPETPGGWYDFWTGEHIKGGQKINREVPINIMPLYAKAGSILPMGPEEQYASEKTAGPIELRVYPGSDAAFDLYNDEGENYNYEHGAYSIIPIRWSEKMHTLTIGERSGSYPGMPGEMTFRIVWIGKNHGTGVDAADKPDTVVNYRGQKLIIRK